MLYNLQKRLTLLGLCSLVPFLCHCAATQKTGHVDWGAYLGDRASSQYAPLKQINKSNVADLRVAWTYQTDDVWDPKFSQLQTNPLIIDGVLYGVTPRLNPFALDAATGKELWRFDALKTGSDSRKTRREMRSGNARGLVYWQSANASRLFVVIGTKLHALNPKDGSLIRTFGKQGLVDLREGLGRNVDNVYVGASSPGVIYKNLLIQGSRVGEGAGSAPGHIRAYDVRTGEIVWTFHTIPKPGEFGHETWPEDAHLWAGGANSWAGMSVDDARGLVFIPTGSASFDFWGGNRPGQNLFANSVLALNAETGERVWHFQTVHHDIWDRDLPAPPNLLTVNHNGHHIDAVAQVTKSGHVFLFERDTGQPLFPIEEKPVPASTLIGERTWPTQPMTTKPAPFARQQLVAEDVRAAKNSDGEDLRTVFATLSSGGQFTPFDTQGTVILPGLDGGAEWGGAATDPNGILYINANEMPWIGQLHALDKAPAKTGSQSYAKHCASCHGEDQKGGPLGQYPNLTQLPSRYEQSQVKNVIRRGRGFMPSFNGLSNEELQALVAFLWGTDQAVAAAVSTKEDLSMSPAFQVPYRFNGYHRFVDQHGNAAIKQPWGTLNAIDLNSGEQLWQVTLGDLPEFAEKPGEPTGTENYGGPIVTAGGLVFIAATKDEMFRAFDRNTGRLLWQTKLPFGGYATPATYQVDGKQYVVIAAGGGKMGTPSGGAYVAFSLP